MFKLLWMRDWGDRGKPSISLTMLFWFATVPLIMWVISYVLLWTGKITHESVIEAASVGTIASVGAGFYSLRQGTKTYERVKVPSSHDSPEESGGEGQR